MGKRLLCWSNLVTIGREISRNFYVTTCGQVRSQCLVLLSSEVVGSRKIEFFWFTLGTPRGMDIVEYYRRKARGLDLPSIKQSIERHLQPDHDRECDVEEIRLYLENVVKAMPGLDESQVILFGSRRSNVMTGDSDADFCLLLPIGIKLDDVDVSHLFRLNTLLYSMYSNRLYYF